MNVKDPIATKVPKLIYFLTGIGALIGLYFLMGKMPLIQFIIKNQGAFAYLFGSIICLLSPVITLLIMLLAENKKEKISIYIVIARSIYSMLNLLAIYFLTKTNEIDIIPLVKIFGAYNMIVVLCVSIKSSLKQVKE